MKLLLDEMFTSAISAALVADGHDVVAVVDRPELRSLDGHEILTAAADDKRAVVTENVRDFALMDREWAALGRTHGGMVFTSRRRFDRGSLEHPGSLIRALGRFLADPPVEGGSWTWWL